MRKIKVVVLLVQQLQHGFTKNAKVSPNLTVAHLLLIITVYFYFILFFLLPHTSLLMADANAMYHPSFIIYYSSTHYLFTYYFLINPFFFHLGWLMLTSFSS